MQTIIKNLGNRNGIWKTTNYRYQNKYVGLEKKVHLWLKTVHPKHTIKAYIPQGNT